MERLSFIRILSQAKRYVLEFRYRNFPVVFGLIVVLFIFTAVFGEFLAPYSPTQVSLTEKFLPPFFLADGTWAHPLGTDHLGRDMLSRIMVGSRPSLMVALAVVFLGGVGGSTIGMISGYAAGKTDIVIMRAADSTMAFPIILMAMLLSSVLGASTQNVIVAITLIAWARYARVVRGEVLSVKERDFVRLARVAGVSGSKIVLHHIFPNVLHTVLVMLTLQIGMVIMVEASLSFLGLGVPPPAPVWGGLIAAGREYIRTAWWITVFPGAFLALVVLSFNMLGDWLREVMDPKLRQA